jgi:hypothetical protein
MFLWIVHLDYGILHDVCALEVIPGLPMLHLISIRKVSHMTGPDATV